MPWGQCLRCCWSCSQTHGQLIWGLVRPGNAAPVGAALRCFFLPEVSWHGANPAAAYQENKGINKKLFPLDKYENQTHSYIYSTACTDFLTKEQPTGRFPLSSEQYYGPCADKLNQKFLNWCALQTHSKSKKSISDKHFKTSSCNAITSREIYHLIFQTTYPTAPAETSKNYWVLSTLEEQDAYFRNSWRVPAWTQWHSTAHQCALAPILAPAPLQHTLLCLAVPMAASMADCSESSWDVLHKGLCDVPNHIDPCGTRRYLCLQTLLPSTSSHTILEPRRLACCRHTQVYGI